MNAVAKDLLIRGARDLGVSLTTADLGRFYLFAQELKKWSRKINLTAITTDEDVAVKHFLDSLTLLKVIRGSGKLIDIGSGAGFPAIPLKIVLHNLQVISVDAVEKKVIFQRHAARYLGLTRFEAIHERAEELSGHHAASCDWVVSRAFADIPTFARLALPLLRENGKIVAMKGKGGREEAEKVSMALSGLGLKIATIEAFSLPFYGDARTLVVMEK